MGSAADVAGRQRKISDLSNMMRFQICWISLDIHNDTSQELRMPSIVTLYWLFSKLDNVPLCETQIEKFGW